MGAATTKTKNVSLHYSGHHKRWMSAGDSLAMLGFPIYNELSNVRGSGARCCSFVPGGSLTPSAPSRSRNKKIGFAGNSQHVAVNVFMKIDVLLFARRAEQNQQHPISQIFRACFFLFFCATPFHERRCVAPLPPRSSRGRGRSAAGSAACPRHREVASAGTPRTQALT